MSTRFFLSLSILFLVLPAAFALDAPDVSSSTHPENEWSNFKALVFKWGEVEGASEYCYVLDADSSGSAPDEPCTSDLTVILPPKISSGDYYFHVKAVSGSQESSTESYHIKLDIDPPEKPVLSGKAIDAGSLELSWETEPDKGSGVDIYQVYRSFMGDIDIRDRGVSKIADVESTSTTFVDEGLLAGRTYHYVVRAVDKTGNIGKTSNEVHVQTLVKCDLQVTFNAVLSEDEKTLQLSLSTGDDNKIYHGGLSVALPDGSERVFFEEAEPFSEWSEGFDLSGISQGYFDFSVSVKEFFGDDCSFDQRFVYDITDPLLEFSFPKYNDNVSETVPLQAEAEDQGSFKSGIQSVAFYIGDSGSWSKLGDAALKDGTLYEYMWDSFSVENGAHEIRAVVLDEAGNEVDASKPVNVLNAFQGSVDFNSATRLALDARQAAYEEKWALQANGIGSDEVNRLIEEGDIKIGEALALAGQGGLENETNAKIKLAEAIVGFEEVPGVVQAEVYREESFIFNKEQVDLLLSAAGIFGQQAEQAKLAIDNYSPERKLRVLKVTDLNSEYYRALIVVSFSLDVNVLQDSNIGDDVMQVIEVIPKEFAEYAREIDSNVSFTVLEDDPKLSFTLKKEQYRARQLVYALNRDFSQLQADELFSDNTINKFVAPPVMLAPGQPPFSFSLPGGLPFEYVLYAFFGAIVVVCAAFLFLYFRKRGFGGHLKKPKGFFGGKKPKPRFGVKKEMHEEKPGQKPKKPKKPFSGFGVPKLGKKEESPLSVFGKK